MKIKHHPAPENLMSCSAGSQPEAFAAVMSSHLAMCPSCRQDLTLLDDVGAALFDRLGSSQITRDAPAIALRAGEAEVDTQPTTAPWSTMQTTSGGVPGPLVSVIGKELDAIKWKRVAPGVWQHQIKLSNRNRGELRLIRVAPGQAMPEHAHTGSELTLVLRGAYTDVSGTYRTGDVADMPEDDTHAPIADPVEGCICLIASEGKLRFKSVIARLIQPLTGF